MLKIPQKVIICVLVVLALSLAGTACQDSPQNTPEDGSLSETPMDLNLTATRDVKKTPASGEEPEATATPTRVVVPTDTPDEIEQNCCAVYSIGLLNAPSTLNPWRYLASGNDPWTGYVIGDEALRLFAYPALKLPYRPDFVPALAADLPPEPVQAGDLWAIRVEILDAALWSDGEPVTAADVVFTVQTARNLLLGGRWDAYYGSSNFAKIEADGDRAVKFYFQNVPSLGDWQFGFAMGPILPAHYWGEMVQDASVMLEGVDLPATCAGTRSEAEQTACGLLEEARQMLFAVEPVKAPSGGPYITAGFTSGRTLRREANPHYYADDVKISEYADGTWGRTFPDGEQQRFYGDSDGKAPITYHRGPHNPAVQFVIYGSRAAAYDALSKGKVDTVLDPAALTEPWLLQYADSDEIELYTSQKNSLGYMAFNLRHVPGSVQAFRQAIALLVDKEALISDDYQGLYEPATSVVPLGNAYWHNPQLQDGTDKLTAEERFNLAIQILRADGWTWRNDPAWDTASGSVKAGDEMRVPGGQPLSTISLLYPEAASDPLLADFGRQVADILEILGVEFEEESLDRGSLVSRVFLAGGSFDLYLLDWQLPLYPDYLCSLFDSDADTLLTGELNSSGYTNPDFDLLCDDWLSEADFEASKATAYQLQVVLAEDLPYLPLYYPLEMDQANLRVVLPYPPGLGGLPEAAGFQGDARVLIE